MNALGSTTYGLLRSLLAPTNPKDKSFAQLAVVLQKHLEPKPNVIAERFKFHHRNQQQGELVGDYVAELRRLASRCSFVDYLTEVLQDRLFCGLRSESTQKKLLAEEDLTLDRAVAVAQSMEAALKHSQTLKSSSDLTVGQIKQ